MSAQQPKRSDFGGGRSGAAAYNRAMREWKVSNRTPEPPNKPQRNAYPNTRSGSSRYSSALRDWRTGDTPTPAPTPTATTPAPAPQTPTGRSTPAPNGGSGTGTQTSPRQMTMEEANSLLGGGYKLVNPFSSTQLPATSGNPYFGNSNTPEYRSDVPADTYDVQLSRNLTDGSPFNTDGYTYEVPTNTNIEYLQENGSPKIALPGASKTTDQVDPGNKTAESTDTNRSARIPKRPKGARAAEMWDRQYGRMDQSTSTSETKGSGIDYARRSAFLDAPGSMQGLRRVEAQKGIVYAGGQHNMVNPNQGQEGQSDFLKISKEDRDAYMGDRMTADGLKGKYVKDIKEATKSEPVSPKNVGENYWITESEKPTSRIDSTAQVDTGVITKAPTLMEEVDVRFTDKDKSGRYNVF